MSGVKVENADKITKGVCDVNITNHSEKSPLHLLVQKKGDDEKNLKAIKLLLSAGADVNSKDQQDKTPLYLALKAKRSKEIIEALIEAGADLELSYTDEESRVNGTILLHAVIPIAIHRYKNAYSNKFKDFEFSYIDVEITKLLIDKAARIENAGENTTGCSPLLAAALFCRTDLVKLMLKHISIKEVNLDSVISHHPFFGKFRLNSNVTMSFPPYDSTGWDILGSTALHLSIFHSDLDMATALIVAGADRNIKDDSGKTPIHHAIEGDKHDFLELLVKGCVENAKESKQK